jgi:hypothetical protein
MDRRRSSITRRLLTVMTALGTTLGVFAFGAAPATALPCTGPTVAAIGDANDASQNDVVTKLQATCLFTQVDRIDLWNGTPDLQTLNGYDAVLVYSGSGFPNNVAIGNVLADYVDGGGHVVVSALAFWTSNHPLGMAGRLSTDGYLPFTQGPQAAGNLHLVADRPLSPYLANVDSFDGGLAIQNVVSLTGGAKLIAHWSSGAPLVAVKSHVVGLNFYPPSSDIAAHFWNASTDGDILMANALLGGGVATGTRDLDVTVGNGLETQSRSISPGHPTTFVFTLTNRGALRDSFTALGETNDGIMVQYFSGRTDVTDAVVAGTYETGRRAPGRTIKIKLLVHVMPEAPTDVTIEIGFVGASLADPTATDDASAEVVVT